MPQRFDLPIGDKIEWIDVYLFTDVTNAKDIRNRLSSGLELSIITTDYIPSAFVLQITAIKALFAKANDSLKCHSVYSELIFMLYPTTNMKQAFATFGINDSSTSMIVINYSCSPLKDEDIKELVKGKEDSIQNLSQYCSEEAIKKLYKLTEQELKISTLEQSIITRVVAKEHMK